MKIFRGESHSTDEKIQFEQSEMRAVEYARCEMLLESLEWAIEHHANVILQRHSMGLARKLVLSRMLEIDAEVRAETPHREKT